ncbi:MAG: hypothetical protein Q9191_007974 [Dirinaria sp. TL-2023a]
MAITIDFCSAQDFHRVFSLASDAFGYDTAYHNALYPNHYSDAGRLAGAERFRHISNTDFKNRFTKATDTATGEIIGFARWIIFASGEREPELSGDFWETQDEKNYAACLYEGFLRPRRETVDAVRGLVVSLDILAVDPKHQRRGGGTKLMEWGVKLADEVGAEMCVEASPAGKQLYERHGFRVTEKVVLMVPQKWADRPVVEYVFMRRPMTTAVLQ